MSALIDEAHEFLCIMDKQEYADEVYRLRARVAELEAQIAAPADHSARVLDMVAPAAAVPDVFEGWEITCGGAYTNGAYSVVKRIDGKGWNGCAILNDELVSVVEAVPLDTAIIQCNRHAHAARQPSQDVVRDAESADDCCRGAAPARFCKCSNTDERLRIATSMTHAVIDLNRGWNEHLPKGEIAERLDLCRRFAIAILASNKEKGQ